MEYGIVPHGEFEVAMLPGSHLADEVDVQQYGAVHPQEAVRVQLADHVLDALPHLEFLICRVYQDVVTPGLYVAYLAHADELDPVAYFHLEHVSASLHCPRRRRWERHGHGLQPFLPGATQPATYPLYCLPQALPVIGLEQVIDRLDPEGP